MSQNTLSQNISPLTGVSYTPTLKLVSSDEVLKKLTYRNQIAKFVNNKIVEFSLIILIIGYTLMVFASFAIEDISNKTDYISNLDEITLSIHITEIVLLSIFLIEIFLRMLAFGFRKYLRDALNFLDFLIIILSLALVIADINYDQKTFNAVSRIFRAFFRLFRIFLVFRKVTLFTIIKRNYSKFNLKTPVEKCLEILSQVMNKVEDQTLLSDLQWCIEMISLNKLYDPLLELGKSGDSLTKNNDAMNWIENYSIQSQRTVTRKRNSQFSLNPKTPHSAGTKSIFSHHIQNIQNEDLALGKDIEIRLKDVENLEFNSFEFQKLTNNEGLNILLVYLFENYNLYNQLNIEKNILKNFAKKIEIGTHALDVCQTIFFFLKKCRFKELADLNDVEIASMLLAAAVHDYEHPGLTNNFLIMTRSDFALRYNDKSVLENHHISSSWFIAIQDEKCDIFSGMKSDDYKLMRTRMIAMVLSTDMSAHFGDLAKTKARVASGEIDLKDKDKYSCMDTLLHAADISNPVKPFDIYFEWTSRILTEYWNQGDKERDLEVPISYLMDRYTVNTAKSQIGFIDVIVKPLYEVVKFFLPDLNKNLIHLEQNKEIWQSRINEYDIKLAELAEEKLKKENKDDVEEIMLKKE